MKRLKKKIDITLITDKSNEYRGGSVLLLVAYLGT